MGARKGITADLGDIKGFCAGLNPGEVTVVCGGKASGKTALAMHVAAGAAALAAGAYALVFSPGATADGLARRGLCRESVLVDDRPQIGMGELCARTRAAARRFNLRLVVVDGIGAVGGARPGDRAAGRADAMGGVKSLADELGIPAVVVAEGEARPVPPRAPARTFAFLKELAPFTDQCICLARDPATGVVSYCMSRR